MKKELIDKLKKENKFYKSKRANNERKTDKINYN